MIRCHGLKQARIICSSITSSKIIGCCPGVEHAIPHGISTQVHKTPPSFRKLVSRRTLAVHDSSGSLLVANSLEDSHARFIFCAHREAEDTEPLTNSFAECAKSSLVARE